MIDLGAVAKKSRFVWALVVAMLLDLLAVAPIDLTNSDVGRHVINGQEMMRAFVGRGSWDVLFTNYYSYAYTDFPFVNHHWLSGVVFYYFDRMNGVEGLRALQFVIMGATFVVLCLWLGKKAGYAAMLCGVGLTIPLLITRSEVRPEAFTYLFVVLYLLILSHTRRTKTMSIPLIILLGILQMLWVNFHVYFILGIVLYGYFSLDWHRQAPFVSFYSWQHVMGLVVLLIASCINPYSVKALVFPFLILTEYGYDIVENKSLHFLLNWGMRNQQYTHMVFVDVLVLLSGLTIFWKKKLVFYWFLAAVFCAWASVAVRNTMLAGIFASVWFAVVLHEVYFAALAQAIKTTKAAIALLVVLCILVANLFVYGSWYGDRIKLHTSSVFVEEERARREFLQSNIKGPIFNNYDIGGYLIYTFFPKQKLFVDNRPEAYPVSFFKNEYTRIHEPAVFAKLDETYGFNSVIFQYRDVTGWAQGFLRNITQDKKWVPVYVDSRVVVFVKDNDRNKKVIDQNRLPPDVFQFR